ncbi:TIGR03440 family protein [Synechococcus sp. PCC 6312]|nr:TIGR03440 family protein [Synechococcus sp. PCC 6312]
MLISDPQAALSRHTFIDQFFALRQASLSLFDSVSPAAFCHQAHPDFSPVGWHLGHIGWTEGLWLLPKSLREQLTPPDYNALFAASGLPKTARSQLPPLQEICTYLATIRAAILTAWVKQDFQAQEWLAWWLLQHEAQHGETIQMILALQAPNPLSTTVIPVNKQITAMVTIPAGVLKPSAPSLLLLDNEKPGLAEEIPAFQIDQQPVSRGQFQYFIESGGYETEQWWTAEGWAWRKQYQINQPRYWAWPVSSDHPVCGVSWYEAAAYAAFMGKQLPTEHQWERAQQVLQAPPRSEIPLATPRDHYTSSLSTSSYGFGQVWEWTDTWFHPYPGFCSSPYPGYSAAYFDRAHRVLKGQSFASQPLTQRPSFRNWYHPHTQEIFAGIRCVRT